MIYIPDLSISRYLQNNLFIINNSYSMTIRYVAEKIILSKYCPIISQNRPEGNICFTVVPYKRPDNFDLTTLKEETFSIEKINEIILSNLDPIPIASPELSPETLLEYKKGSIHSSLSPATLTIEFIDSDYPIGKMVDFGCGIGSNASLFLKKDWEVFAIDCSSYAINFIKEKYDHYNKTKKFSFLEADITKIEIEPESFDAAVCVDVLSYISPLELFNTIKKIRECLKPNGIFIGTLFFKNSITTDEFIKKSKELLSCTLYDNPTITKSLLEYSGFIPEKSLIRTTTKKTPITTVEFLAKKA